MVAGIWERRGGRPPAPSPHASSERCSLADSNFVLGNAQVAGLFPVVYCSDGFCDLTGFSRAEVMQRGCACSFLYGPDTSELVRQQIRKALDEHKEFKAELILYRKSGEGPPGQPASPLQSYPAWHQPHPLSLLLSVAIFSISPSHPIFPSPHPTPLAPSDLLPVAPHLYLPHPRLSLHSVPTLGFPHPTEKHPHFGRADLPRDRSGCHVCSPLPPPPNSIKPCPQ